MPILDETIDLGSRQPGTSQSADSASVILNPANLAARKAELADLRFEIILIARWESSDIVESDRKAQLRGDLVQLRQRYSEKIDEIAINFGVPQAIEAQLDVEKNVSVPRGAKLPGALRMD